jgi:hypothetical protein
MLFNIKCSLFAGGETACFAPTLTFSAYGYLGLLGACLFLSR